ncbi:MAG: ABC transporter permease, partial [Gemmatimonadota bacterium]|nr:ABC transporter permease [Gemmatimonadota bacterium]
REFAVRVALGAARGRVVRQLLTESAILAVAGGIAGLALAALALAALRDLALTALPAYAELRLDWGAVLVTGAVALAAGAAFGLVPALSVGGGNVQSTLRDEGRGSSERRHVRHLRGALVAGQVALSVSLLAGAGLLVRSLLAITGAPMGYDPAGVLTGVVQLPVSEFATSETRAQLFERFEERLEALPGVTAVASTTELPTAGMNRNVLTIEGVTLPGGEGQTFIQYMSVSHDYFRTMGIRLVRGRTFDGTDAPGAPPAIVISEAMARHYWPEGDAIGARVRISPHTAERPGEIVGIVEDVRTDLALPEPDPMVYASNRQDFMRSNRTFLIRTAGEPMALARPVQRELTAIDPRLAFRSTATLESMLADGLAGRRLPAVLMTAFGALALVLASVGVYALFAAMVAAREREFGIRLALGSRPGAIARLVVWGGAGWMALGLAGGAIGVVIVARFVRSLLYGVPALDPVALGGAVLTLLVCAAVALYLPVRRAARVDPIMALK